MEILFIAGCGPASEDDQADSASLIFEEELQPLFERRCASGCHVPAGFNGALYLGEDYGEDLLVGKFATQAEMLLVAPGNLDESYLWHKLQNTHEDVGGEGEAMPYASWPLPEDELKIIESYILALE